jgi:uncharacterized protein
MPDKLQTLGQIIKPYKKIAIAFSGGVDSSFLAAVAKKCCDSAIAITVKSEFQSKREAENAAFMARALGICHVIVEARILDDFKIAKNTGDRCYFCKKTLFSLLKKKALELGFTNIAHGANLDDLNDYRPGFKASRQMGITAPLIEAKLTKALIREYSRQLGLETWDMPSQSCLATRIPYGESINRKKLAMVEAGEKALYELGFTTGRIRCHGEVARIELEPDDLARIIEQELRQTMVKAIRLAGFKYIALDLEGYIPGSMNRSLQESSASQNIESEKTNK